MRTVLLGYGNVGKAFAKLLESKRHIYPFPIVGILTKNHGSAFNSKGLGTEPKLEPGAVTLDELLGRTQPSVLVEITTLNPKAESRRFRIFVRRFRKKFM